MSRFIFSSTVNRIARLAMVVALLAVLQGCQTIPAQPRMTLEEVVKMSQAGTPAGEIINALDERGIYLGFTGSQLARLKEQGVSDDVLDYLLREQNRYARRQAYVGYGSLGYDWWHYPPYYYRYPSRVVVVEPPRR